MHWTVSQRGGPEDGSAVSVGHKVYYFGGDFGEPMDVYVFNIVSLRWRMLPPVVTRRGERPLEVPCRRWDHTAVLVGDIVYIWGGWEMDDICDCNAVYAFEVNTHRWFKPRTSGTLPEARMGHSACVLGKVMYVFGGCNHLTDITNDIYKLDTTTMVWSLINITGTPPPASSLRHSATIIGTKMFVFGVLERYPRRDNNIRVFDTETNGWMITPPAQALPDGRSDHLAFTYNGELYIFGGCAFDLKNDMWKFNPETFSWKEVKPKGNGPLKMFGGCCCMMGNCVILFGGLGYLFILDLSPSLKTLCKLAVIQYGLDQSELPQDLRWELAAMNKEYNK